LFVVFNQHGVCISYKLRQCSKYNIPAVNPKYVDKCLTKGRILDAGPHRIGDANNNVEFKKGVIQGLDFAALTCLSNQ